MSDTYVPDLMELNSYWQKAVEDAIQDTVKGEEKLQTALRNRKKINEKLKKMGLEPIFSWWPFKKGTPAKQKTGKEEKEEEHNLDSDTTESAASMEGESFHELDSRISKQTDTPFEDDKQDGPMRPMFGNGSLEKIKRSQNSFNCEPMGDRKSEEMSETDKEGGPFLENNIKNSEVERKKNIEWLHVRDDHDFENSDSASSTLGEEVEPVQLLRHPFVLSKKIFLNRKLGVTSKKKIPKMLRKLQKQPSILSENDSNSILYKQRDLKRRLELALAKREILNKKRKLPGGCESKVLIKVSLSAMRAAKKRTKGKKQLSAFIRFYLSVYRDLCLKMPVKRITEEAAKRWQMMNAKEKAEWEEDGRKFFDF